ncbi:hypothetical protein T12_8860 [Trichinella patagoniensis]|uniref:Uncharacterized protein n=1 Tax=Trichinella patagoniensis TaxID=990121 RepID=A0A0V1ABD0_9BILA|nr:hypothetical protein T12_8860 [Trichinella patagoniensis]
MDVSTTGPQLYSIQPRTKDSAVNFRITKRDTGTVTIPKTASQRQKSVQPKIAILSWTALEAAHRFN